MGIGGVRAAEVFRMRQHRAFIKNMCGQCQCTLKMQRREVGGSECAWDENLVDRGECRQPLMDAMSSAYECYNIF